MKQYMSDSSITDLDPRELILDPYLQARDPELITKNKDRDAQLRKQLSQDNDILEELLNGGEIRQPITVFKVDTKLYVVDGFHRCILVWMGSWHLAFHGERAALHFNLMVASRCGWALCILAFLCGWGPHAKCRTGFCDDRSVV